MDTEDFKWTEGKVREFSKWIIGPESGAFPSLDEAINTFKKLKGRVPLFTTEDGINIYEGGRAWHVDEDFNIDFYDFIVYANKSDLTHYPHRYKYFSSEDLAKEYVLNNKPLFSLNEIIKIKENKGYSLIDELINIAKSKINNQ